MEKMYPANNIVTLLSPQTEEVWEAVGKSGSAYTRREHIEQKYGDCADIFFTAFEVLNSEAAKIVKRPDNGVFPFWAYTSADQMVRYPGRDVMKLSVPAEEIVFFDQYDWYRVLRMTYLGESLEDEIDFARKLESRGIRDPLDAVLKPFYPDVKREIEESWKRIFRYDKAIKDCIAREGRLILSDELSRVSVQAGMWRLDKDWLTGTA